MNRALASEDDIHCRCNRFGSSAFNAGDSTAIAVGAPELSRAVGKLPLVLDKSLPVPRVHMPDVRPEGHHKA